MATSGKKRGPVKKTGAGKKEKKPGKAGAAGSFEIDMDRFASEVVEAAEEINRVSAEKSSLEDIEGAKAMTGIILDKYADFLKRLDRTGKKKLEHSLGPGVEQIKKGLRLLKEAPE